MKKLVLSLFIIMMISSSWVFASGLSIPEQGAAAMGTAAAATARSEDLSSIYYNPAGINYVESFEIMLGATPIRPQHKYTPFQKEKEIFRPAEAEKKTFLPPQLYAAYRARKNLVLGLVHNQSLMSLFGRRLSPASGLR